MRGGRGGGVASSYTGAELKSKLIDSGCCFTPFFFPLISFSPPLSLMLEEVIQSGAEVVEEMKDEEKEEEEECTWALSPPRRPLSFFFICEMKRILATANES